MSLSSCGWGDQPGSVIRVLPAGIPDWREAPSPDPYSLTVVMDSGLALRAPRNDGRLLPGQRRDGDADVACGVGYDAQRFVVVGDAEEAQIVDAMRLGETPSSSATI